MKVREVRNAIEFVLNDEPVEVRDAAPTMTVLRYLREGRRSSGTKEGCAGGDCGACTVLVTRRRGARVVAETVNACIALLPMLDRTVVRTVDRLAGPGGALHPSQQAMIECHGSQCGFCTPGFAMSLYALYNEHVITGTRPDRHAVDDALGGNLCRCTGYSPIIAAAQRMFELPRPDWVLDRISHDARMLSPHDSRDDVVLSTGNQHAFIPASEAALFEMAAANPDARIVAGATDVGLWVTKQTRRLGGVIFLHGVADPGFHACRDDGTAVHISAGVTHSTAMAHPGWHPDMREIWRRFAGRQVRNAGTVCGNIANGSPIGDLAPAFIALDARVDLRCGAQARTVPLEDFFIAYGRQDRRPGEIVASISVPHPEVSEDLSIHKVSKRFDDDISTVCGAFNIAVRGGAVTRARAAFGGMAATPKRAQAVEAALIGKPWSRETIDAALPAFEQDFQPLSDMRGSAAYRMAVAKNLLVRTFIERSTPRTVTRLVGPSGVVEF